MQTHYPLLILKQRTIQGEIKDQATIRTSFSGSKEQLVQLANSKEFENNKGSKESKDAPSTKIPTLTCLQRKQPRTLREKGNGQNGALSIILNKDSAEQHSRKTCPRQIHYRGKE